MRTIKNLWCSVHQPTEEQKRELTETIQINVIGTKVTEFEQELIFLKDVNPELQSSINSLQFDSSLNKLAQELVSTIDNGNYTPAQIGGSPAFIFRVGVIYGEMINSDMVRSPRFPRFSFNKRESVDIPQKDGTIKKIAIFKHEGWV